MFKELLLVLSVTGVFANAATVLVDPQANPYFYSNIMPANSPGVSAPVYSLTPGADRILRFTSITGNVSCTAGEPLFGPEGTEGATTCSNDDTDLTEFGGISGIVHANSAMFIVGVFLGPSAPVGPTPTRLSFTNQENFDVLSPLLNQLFFIGDGRRDDNNAMQQFLVPDEATRFVIGFADAFDGSRAYYGSPCCYDDNVSTTNTDLQARGGILAEFDVTSPVPEPSTYTLIALGASALGILRRRHISRSLL